MSQSALKLMAAAGATAETDDNFKQVTALYHFDGTNGAQNQTFDDESTNDYSITRNGNVTQGTYGPFSAEAGKWGTYFGSKNERINLPNDSAFKPGTGDFTVEAWVYHEGVGTLNIVLATSANSGGSGGFTVEINNNAIKVFDLVTTSAALTTTETTVTAHQWHHIVVMRDSGTFYAYVDGTRSSTTASNSSNFQGTTTGGGIGGYTTNPSSAGTQGYISNFRMVKDAVYSGTSITVPTAPLTNIANTSILTCQDNRVIDNSSNSFSLSKTGSVSIQPFGPFAPSAAYSTTTNGGSAYFDGNSDYLDVGTSGATQLGSGNFTVEFWINSTDSSFNFANPKTSTGSGFFAILVQSGDLRWNTSYTVSNLWEVDGAGILDGSWHHVAIVRNSNTFAVYYDGTSQSLQSGSFSDSTNYSGSDGLRLGSGNLDEMTGYLSSFRITQSAVYTSNFTAPTAPLTAIANTEVLLNFTNAAAFDQSATTNAETIGNAQLSTAQKQFGTASLFLDGTGDYLSMVESPDEFGTGDFTIELWWKQNGHTGNYQTWVSKGITGSPSNGAWSLGPYFHPSVAGNTLWFAYYSSGFTDLTGTATTINDGNWHHCAVAREGTNLRMFYDGSLVATHTVSANLGNISGNFLVGYNSRNNQYVNGYIDDMRITKGVARYTASFTAPTKAFPNQ